MTHTPPQHLLTWAQRWNIPPEALRELVTPPDDPDPVPGHSEAAMQAALRIKASQAGWRLWRNNVGAGTLDNGTHLRWGLANDSTRVNTSLKSGDLIGIKPGGQFVSREVKHAGWHYTGTPREVAQLAWIELVNGLGGDAAFSTGGL